MPKLSHRSQLLVGVTLFSMFFGAGNLIFPPFLGLQAGTAALPAFLGFALSAVGLPVLCVIAVAHAGGPLALTGRVSKWFARVFLLLVYLSIGPCLAIPRTASTSFEMAVTPFLPTNLLEHVVWFRIAYSVVFFLVALALALHPNKLVDYLGKVLAPVLLVLIAVLFFGCIFAGGSPIGAPAPTYQGAPAVQGFLDGYQTMDAMAALIFGVVLAMNIRARGLEDDRAVVQATTKAGGIAAVCFLAVYGAITWIGVVSGVSGAENGAAVLTATAQRLFGRPGQVIVAGIFVIACLNTCVSLICCCGEYFHELLPRISYTAWAVVFAVVSAVISNVGLNAILQFSVPILSCLYPINIVLIVLGLLPARFSFKRRPLLYPLPVALAGIVGVVSSLDSAGIALPGITPLFSLLPFYQVGLGWVLPTLIALVIGLLVRRSKAEA